MELIFLIKQILSKSDIYLVTFDCTSHRCKKYFKGGLSDLLEQLPNVIDENLEIRDSIITDDIPCPDCRHGNCNIRDHYEVISKEEIDIIFQKFAELKHHEDAIEVNIDEY